MARVPFDPDVRAGFAHALENVTAGIAELFEVDEQKLKAYDAETIAQLPEGADALFAIIYSTCGFLLERDDDLSTELLSMGLRGFQPAVMKHLGVPLLPGFLANKQEMN